MLRAQVELARMTEEIVRMEAMRAGAAARLNAVLDRPAEAAVPPPVLPSFPAELPSRDSLERLALAHRPMLRAGGEDVHAAEAAERLAGREIWPDLELGVQYGWRPMDEGTDHMVSLMLGLRLPIWAGSRQLAMRRETRAMREMAVGGPGGDGGRHPRPGGRARCRGASRPHAPPALSHDGAAAGGRDGGLGAGRLSGRRRGLHDAARRPDEREPLPAGDLPGSRPSWAAPSAELEMLVGRRTLLDPGSPQAP